MIIIILISTSCSFNKRVQGDALIIGYYGQPEKIDPIKSSSGITANLIDIIYDSLIDITADGKFIPRIAKNWETSSDGLKWDFYLNENIYFHNGHKLTSEDVKFTYDEIINTKHSSYFNMLKYVKEIRVIDEYHIQLILNNYDNIIYTALFHIGIAPKHLFNKKTGFKKTVGSGPFKLITNNENEIKLIANEKYFLKRPYLNKVIVKLYPTQKANLSAMIAGDVDVLFLLDNKDYGALNNIKKYEWLDKTASLLLLNNDNQKFNQKIVRQALNYSINKKLIIKHLIKNEGSPISAMASLRGNSINKKIEPYDYNPKKALKLLAKAGWKDSNGDNILDNNGKKFEFTILVIEENDLDRSIANMIAQQLDEIGIRVNIDIKKFNELINTFFITKDFEAAILFFNLRYDLFSNYTFWHSSQIKEGYNFSSYKNTKIDHLLDIARTEVDETKRKKAYLAFQELLHNDPPAVFLLWRNYYMAIDKRFKGIADHPFEFFKNLPKIWVSKAEQKYD